MYYVKRTRYEPRYELVCMLWCHGVIIPAPPPPTPLLLSSPLPRALINAGVSTKEVSLYTSKDVCLCVYIDNIDCIDVCDARCL